MRFRIVVDVEVERSNGGVFESKDSLSTACFDAIEAADPGTVQGDNGTEYEVTAWEVSIDQ